MRRRRSLAVVIAAFAAPDACIGDTLGCGISPEMQWGADDQAEWLHSHSCPRVKMMADAGATYYPDSSKVFDTKAAPIPAVPSCGHRVAMVFTWADWGKTATGVVNYDEVVVPSYFRFWAESAGMNVGLVDFLIFTTPKLYPHYETAVEGIPNVKIFMLEDSNDPKGDDRAGIANFYAERLDIPDLVIDGEVLKDLKPMHGLVFESYLTEYTHWGFGDIDLIYGDLSRFFTPLLGKHDIITIHASEKPPLGLTNGLHLCKYGTLFAGQITVFKNNDYNRHLFEVIPDWKGVLPKKKKPGSRSRRHLSGKVEGRHRQLKYYGWAALIFDEKLMPQAILDSGRPGSMNDTGIIIAQLTDQYNTPPNLVWSQGKLLVLDAESTCVAFEAALVHMMGVKYALKKAQVSKELFSEAALASVKKSFADGGRGGTRLAFPVKKGDIWGPLDDFTVPPRCT